MAEWFSRGHYEQMLHVRDPITGERGRWIFNPFKPMAEGLEHHWLRFGVRAWPSGGAVALPAWAAAALLAAGFHCLGSAVRYLRLIWTRPRQYGFEPVVDQDRKVI